MLRQGERGIFPTSPAARYGDTFRRPSVSADDSALAFQEVITLRAWTGCAASGNMRTKSHDQHNIDFATTLHVEDRHFRRPSIAEVSPRGLVDVAPVSFRAERERALIGIEIVSAVSPG
jgi:hypothetical protein